MKKRNVLSRCLGSRACGYHCPPSANHLLYASSRVSPGFNLSLSLRFFIAQSGDGTREERRKNIRLEFLNLTIKLIFVVDFSVWRRPRSATVCPAVYKSCTVYRLSMTVPVFCKRFLSRMTKVRETDSLIGTDVPLWKFYAFPFPLAPGIALQFGSTHV